MPVLTASMLAAAHAGMRGVSCSRVPVALLEMPDDGLPS